VDTEQTELFLNLDQLQELTRRTIGHYEFNAESYRTGTADHDVSQNYAALLDAIETEKPFKILDLGCGPGRDLKYLKSLGHIPVGVEGSETFVEVATKLSGCDVYHMDFIKLDLHQAQYDGIFANATLFHIPRQEIKRVMMELYDSLKERGILFCSNPRGNNQEGFSGERYGFYYDWNAWKQICLDSGYEEVQHFFRPDGIPEEERPWLASVWRK
jgi:SAM-dependent methyltransferase